MRDRVSFVLVWVLAVAITTAPLMADVQTAMIRPQGQVKLNGGLADRTSAIFPGDSLQTGQDSSVAITAEGSTILLASNTSVLFGDNRLEFAAGSATVNTSYGLTTQVGPYQIAPAGKALTRYQVAESQGQVHVMAMAEPLSITAPGAEPALLAPGSVMTLPAAAPAQNAGVGAGSSSFLSQNAQLIILLVAAAAAGIGVAVANSVLDDESPSGP